MSLFTIEKKEIKIESFGYVLTKNISIDLDFLSKLRLDNLIDLDQITSPEPYDNNKYIFDLRKLHNSSCCYILWVRINRNNKREDYEAIYVGSTGNLAKRIKQHIDKIDSNIFNRIRNIYGNNQLFLSNVNCELRVAKYLEQLYLDYYNFQMNKKDIKGVNGLIYRKMISNKNNLENDNNNEDNNQNIVQKKW